MTKYAILYRAKDADAADWRRLPGTIEAASGSSASRAAAQKLHAETGSADGDFVAIPERSWDPITIEIETNPRVKVVKP